MRSIKKLDIYVLKNFLGLFLATLFICIFILLMQFVWMHVNDLVGKGVGIGVMAEFMIYAIASVIPLALPLAILLASLISFGNLGEKFELIAMKSAGISLFRIMRPLTIAIAILSVGAFFFSNNVLPKSQVKLWTLIFSLRQKSPELDIPQGEFYHGIRGYNIYVRHKDPNGLLQDMMIYDFSRGFNETVVCVADSGRLFFTEDKQYLVLRLYNGESFENLSREGSQSTIQNIPYRRETFAQKQLLIAFSTDFSRYDESVLDDQHVAKNAQQLIHSIDSVQDAAHRQSREQSQILIASHYFGRDRETNRTLTVCEPTDTIAPCTTQDLIQQRSIEEHQRAATMAVEQARQYSDQITFNALVLDDHKAYVRRHEIELFRKFTLAFACLIFFFIGAPLGAIIRKGGLGAPVVISVLMFIVYYIIDNTGYKMAREAIWPCWTGMWLSSFVLLPIGIFLTYKAATDSALLNPEAWLKVWQTIQQKIQQLWIKLKTH